MSGARSVVARAAVVAVCGCAGGRGDPAVAWLVVDAPPENDVVAAALGEARLVPQQVVLRATRSGARLVVAIDAREAAAIAQGAVRVEVPGACTLEVASSKLVAGATVQRTLVPWIDLRVPDHAHDLGYDAPFAVEAILGCPAATASGSIAWRQVSGPALRGVAPEVRGPRFEARTPRADDVMLAPPAWGIVPVAARTSGEVEIEAEWRRGEASVRRRARVAAASRAHGVPNVAVDAGLLLAGRGWSIARAPAGSSARVAPASDGIARVVPDVAGSWLLRDGDGRTLSVRAGRYDETPLDCGRAGCHGTIADAAQASPMTHALRTRVEAFAQPGGAAACTLACHATGEPGVHDGGFVDVARATNWGDAIGGAWNAMPRALRRLGGVTCLACHGPGAVPEESARWSILRADVCATCHDAPPRYGHVAAWRSSRMSRSDADPRVRSGACARCHTTSGFLASVGGRREDRAAPPEAGSVGVACAACHAVHADHAGGAASALVRDVPLPAALDGVSVATAARPCVACHSPSRRGDPVASAAAMWAGRGGIDPENRAPIVGPAPHGAIEGSCVGCHRAGPDVERGAGHAFRASDAACASCHGGPVTDLAATERRLHEQATDLYERLVRRGVVPRTEDGPPHATTPSPPDDAMGRAAYDVMLVLEDPAAAAHGAPYARALLAAASRAIAAHGGPR